MTICLTREELVELTGKKHRDAQQRVLVALRIEHKMRPDGEILVARALVEQWLGVKVKKEARVHEPDWDALKK